MKSVAFLRTLVLLMAGFTAGAQKIDSTDKFKFYPLETIENEIVFNDGTVFQSESYRSSFLIENQRIRDCYLTVKLIEYKAGKKIGESAVLSKTAVGDRSMLRPFEDSALVFSLYRKHNDGNLFIWGFRTPTSFSTKAIKYDHKENEYTVVAIPQNFLNNKIPIGTAFPLLVITSPDKNGNMGFFQAGNKNKYPVSEWNNKYNLDHTFVVELTIERPAPGTYSYNSGRP